MRMRTSRERRDKPTRMDQPAEKRRRVGENEYKRVIQNTNTKEKRKDEEVQVENKPKTFQIFNIKRRKMNETPELEKAAQKVREEEKIDERDWDREIWLRDEEMKRIAKARTRRIAEAKRKEKSYRHGKSLFLSASRFSGFKNVRRFTYFLIILLSLLLSRYLAKLQFFPVQWKFFNKNRSIVD